MLNYSITKYKEHALSKSRNEACPIVFPRTCQTTMFAAATRGMQTGMSSPRCSKRKETTTRAVASRDGALPTAQRKCGLSKNTGGVAETKRGHARVREQGDVQNTRVGK
jgi:hypothetical protein